MKVVHTVNRVNPIPWRPDLAAPIILVARGLLPIFLPRFKKRDHNPHRPFGMVSDFFAPEITEITEITEKNGC